MIPWARQVVGVAVVGLVRPVPTLDGRGSGGPNLQANHPPPPLTSSLLSSSPVQLEVLF